MVRARERGGRGRGNLSTGTTDRPMWTVTHVAYARGMRK